MGVVEYTDGTWSRSVEDTPETLARCPACRAWRAITRADYDEFLRLRRANWQHFIRGLSWNCVSCDTPVPFDFADMSEQQIRSLPTDRAKEKNGL